MVKEQFIHRRAKRYYPKNFSACTYLQLFMKNTLLDYQNTINVTFYGSPCPKHCINPGGTVIKGKS